MGNQKVVQEALYWAQHAPVSTRSFQAEHGFGCPAVGSQRWEWLKCLEHPEQQRQIKTKIQLSEKQLIFTHFSFTYHLLNSACQHHMLCTASRWKIKFVMFLISNAPSFLASSCFHAVACTRLQLQKALCVSCASALCPVSCVLCPLAVPGATASSLPRAAAAGAGGWLWVSTHVLGGNGADSLLLDRAVGTWRSRGCVPAALALSLVCKLCLHSHLLLCQMGLQSSRLLRWQCAAG